jgi:hypothetical protein
MAQVAERTQISDLRVRPNYLTNNELLDAAYDCDRDSLVYELARRLESLSKYHESEVERLEREISGLEFKAEDLEYEISELERLKCGYRFVSPDAMYSLTGAAKSAVINTAALFGYKMNLCKRCGCDAKQGFNYCLSCSYF